jgi:hypothetical protein
VKARGECVGSIRNGELADDGKGLDRIADRRARPAQTVQRGPGSAAWGRPGIWMKVRNLIAYTAAFYPNWNVVLAGRLVHRWEIPLDEGAGTLSVGQLQRLSIVLSLAYEPEPLILDEPAASLDPAPAPIRLRPPLLRIRGYNDNSHYSVAAV